MGCSEVKDGAISGIHVGSESVGFVVKIQPTHYLEKNRCDHRSYLIANGKLTNGVREELAAAFLEEAPSQTTNTIHRRIIAT
jgi:hypothetical protein